MRDRNTGLPGSWSELRCAQGAADETYGEVKSGRTVLRYYRSEYCLLEGKFLAGGRGSKGRDNWASAFLAQDDLVSELRTLIKSNRGHLTLAKAADFISTIINRKTTERNRAHFAATEAAAAAAGSPTAVPTADTFVYKPDWPVAGSKRHAWFWKRYRLKLPVLVDNDVYTIMHDKKVDPTRGGRRKSL